LLVLSVYAAIQVAVTLGTGALLDYYEPRRLVPVAMLFLALASALPASETGVVVSWLYALCLGGAYGSQQAIGAAGYAQYFGRDHLGAIRGVSSLIGVAGAAFGPLPFAASIEWTGSYAVALIGSCVLCVACGAASFAIRRPANSRRPESYSLAHESDPR
jgi:MFS-type transporter involved in bile tolerance (Atg22 family)